MDASFFSLNRQRLAESLQGGIFVLSAYAAMQLTNDLAGQFEQEANFWWLTGIEEPDWWLIADGNLRKTWLVSPAISKNHEVFEGSLSDERAKEISGADEVITRDEAMRLLRNMAKKHSVAYTLGEQPHAEHFDFILNPAPKKMHELLGRTFHLVRDCRKEMAALRAIKQPQEIVAMKQAIDTTIKAYNHIKQNFAEYRYEYEIEAEFSYFFRRHGASGHAYEPIVAAGGSACTLHYTKNDNKLKKRQLVLLDIGARRAGYAADITRTYAYGEPTKRQEAVHKAVQDAQQQIIKLLKPDLLVEEYQRSVDDIMATALMSLGLMSDRSDEETYRTYFPHAVSHGLGVDVHDSLGAPKYLKPGMVLTVEPGIYIPEEGIGVRIEDDILITQKGYENFSSRLSTDLR